MSLNLDFKVQKEQKVREIEDSLQNYLPKQKGYQKIIMEAMGYSLLAGGKRLRPMLMKETYTLFGGHSKVIEPFMAAIEMVHTYSLVHDDLPAMDNDEYRRGRKTTHVVYGEDMAILAGDALLNYAFETAVKAFVLEPEDSLTIGNAIRVLGEKAGIYGMLGGQVIDVKETGHAVSKDVLDTIYELKTGALIEAAMMIGAILGGASQEEVKTVERIASLVGLAFQVQDDILDVISTQEELGKPIHSDEKNEKTTYVTLLGIDDAKKVVEEKSEEAISLLQKYSGYKKNTEMQDAVKQYEEIKASCKSWPLEEVTHVFYHTLIKDPSKAFDGDYKEADYNQVMTTIDEFNKITETMYEKGYVMVSIYDMAKADADGNITEGEILLPEGKIPFVLSQDDVCYYHYMDGDGYASKLVVDENGKIRNEYIEDDGSVSVGDYDMVPLIDRFVEEHPDFSYRGAKGIVALTGYNGILGYRTDQSYETRPDDLDANKVEWLDAHPDFSLAKEREGAKKVADAMKAEGWLFFFFSWGHQNVGQIGLETLQTDTRKFKDNVDPLIGGTDIIIFAFGTDLCGPEDYHGDKFEYLKGAGYNYFCNVDSSKYYVQIRERYFRQGRRNLDGYRMYYHPELLEDLFDVKSVFDPVRPTPVPPMA